MVSSFHDMHIWAFAFGGGLLIGAAAILLYATLGKIAGISGILFGALFDHGAERLWRLLFIGGLVAGGWLALLTGLQPFVDPAFRIDPILLAVGGFAVGFGTRLGNGCTSGHGVCGLGRLSPRSLAAVLVFMAAGFLTATWLRPLLLEILNA